MKKITKFAVIAAVMAVVFAGCATGNNEQLDPEKEVEVIDGEKLSGTYEMTEKNVYEYGTMTKTSTVKIDDDKAAVTLQKTEAICNNQESFNQLQKMAAFDEDSYEINIDNENFKITVVEKKLKTQEKSKDDFLKSITDFGYGLASVEKSIKMSENGSKVIISCKITENGISSTTEIEMNRK